MVIIDHQARKFTYSFLEQPGSRANSPVSESPECQVASVFYSFVVITAPLMVLFLGDWTGFGAC